MVVPLYDDHSTTQSASAEQGDVHTMQTDVGALDAGEQGETDASPGGLDGSTSVEDQNPVEAFIAASNWTREDLQILLSSISIALWVATTLYVANN